MATKDLCNFFPGECLPYVLSSSSQLHLYSKYVNKSAVFKKYGPIASRWIDLTNSQTHPSLHVQQKCIFSDIWQQKTMEVLEATNINQIHEHTNCPTSGESTFFSYSNNVNGLRKPRKTSQNRSHEWKRPCNNLTRYLLVWGCGEFGQHGYDHKGDMTLERSLNKLNSGELLLDGESPMVVASGSSHTLVLSENGNLYSWGNGTSGQLGNGTSQTIHKPTAVFLKTGIQVQGMACGARHSFLWTKDGQSYSFGNNFNAQLGYNFSKADFKENQLQPVCLELFPHMKVTEIACGARHSLFLLTSGHVMAVGCNQLGQIGNDCMDDAVIPTKLEDLSSISHIGCGNSHSLASDVTGRLYAWGYGKAFGSKARYVASPQLFSPKQKDHCAVISLTGGDSHSMALYENGVLYTWGNNYEGQLGLGKYIKYQCEPDPLPNDVLPRPVVQISSGETTCAAITAKGKLYMWGKNAGVIHPEKPSQYFQFKPCHIEIEDKFVRQVSCGAWHVSVIVENAAKLNGNFECQETITNNEVQEKVSIQQSENHLEGTGDGVLQTSYRQSYFQNDVFTDNSTSMCVSGSADCESRQCYAAECNQLETICDTSNNNLHSDVEMCDSYLHMTTDFEMSNKNGMEDEETFQKTECNDNMYSLDQLNQSDEYLSESSYLEMAPYKLVVPMEKFRSESSQAISHETGHHSDNDNSLGLCQNVLVQVTESDRRDEFHEVKELSEVQWKATCTDISDVHTNGITENTRVFKQSWTPPSSKVNVDTDTCKSFSRQHKMPVINLNFGMSSENITPSKQEKPKLGKPNFFSIWNTWNPSNFFREKQSKRKLNRQTRSESEVGFVLESMLPNHPAHTVKEIKKWTKFKDGSKPHVQGREKAATHRCYNQSGKLLPPICSCRGKNTSAEKETFNNVFIERWLNSSTVQCKKKDW